MEMFLYILYIQYTFNRHSICIAPCFAIFQCIFIVCLNDSYLLTYLHSYPKSRDAIASKKYQAHRSWNQNKISWLMTGTKDTLVFLTETNF